MYLITGSASGIGKSVYSFLNKEFDTLGVDLDNSDIICDISKKTNIKNLLEKINSKKIEGVITCAAVSHGPNIIDTNYFGTKLLIEEIYNLNNEINAVIVGSILTKTIQIDNDLVNALVENDRDLILERINFLTDTEIYAACKKALELWMKSFGFNKKNCRINMVSPMLVKTEMTKDIFNGNLIKLLFNKEVESGYLLPEDVAEFIIYLIKNSKNINLQNIYIDNGIFKNV
ncbi:MAG: SDR family oxidoreductase [Nitrososphaeria archaeon]|jgi:NAD(P)-dependent dehydrogenase (short-subunit alcohol dehydrogenase family)|nr:SDR family oxidoreductase [Nitrososphaeria archaeon]